MFSRRYAVLIAVLMIVALVALTVGWVLVSVVGAIQNSEHAGAYWTLLIVGTVLFAALVTGTSLHLTLSVKAINLSRRQSNFIDAVTHELKSPLASLKLTLQTMSRLPLTSEQREDFLRRMLGEVDRLNRLVNHILDAGRSDSPHAADDEQVADLVSVLRQCVETVRIQYQVPAAIFRWEPDELGDLRTGERTKRRELNGLNGLNGLDRESGVDRQNGLDGFSELNELGNSGDGRGFGGNKGDKGDSGSEQLRDSERLVSELAGADELLVAKICPTDAATLFRNLLDNAVKYAGTPPVILIQAERTDNRIVVRITDNGPGIPEERRRRVFLRFVRGDNELEREKPGTGLGLSIVRALVKRWRGTIRIVEQSSPGASFEVRLPQASENLLRMRD